MNCPGETSHGNTWQATLLGTTASGTCAFGFHASQLPPTRNCTNSGVTAVWDSVVLNPCEVTLCHFVNESGTLWPATAVGVQVTGNCSSHNVPKVRPTRICLESSSGSTGIWGPISNPCEVAELVETPFVKIGIPVLVAGLILLALVGFGALLYVYRTKKRRHQTKMAAFKLAEEESNIQLADFEAFGGATSGSLTQTSRSSGNTTMLNTIISGQISLPGFLIMNYGKDIRAEKVIASGGGGKISFGTIVNSDLRAKYPMYSDSIAIKTVEPGEGVSAADSTASFHQEVAVLKYVFFIFFFRV